jgi:large subunit ribosomal protein L3
MKFILAKKESMTQVFSNEGVVSPATILSAGPIVVTQVKIKAKDGYDAVQVGYGTRKEKRISKSVLGHTKKLGNFEKLAEFKATEAHSVGDTLTVGVFAPGDVIEVSGTSKGKGFQGVVKRHGFSGGPRTHGQKHSEREPGSISGGVRNGGRVPKGMRMAGRMGGDRITVRNLKVLQVDEATNTILVSGAVPGRRGTLVEIRAK